MKILIVDDETLIRNGLRAQIDWKLLHIDTVLLAQDGAQALEIAKKEQPELLLTDVRMPHMDGIAFAEACSSLLPESHIIFMSGYSDKEYLKAAIKLRAVSYVEKPIDCAEVTDALREAIRLHTISERNKDAQDLRLREESSRLAVALTHPPEASLISLYPSFAEALKPTMCFATLLLRLTNSFTDLPAEKIESIIQQINDFVRPRNLNYLMAPKYDEYLIFHLYHAHLRESDVLEFARVLQKAMLPCAPFSISVGPVVTSPDEVHTSYEQASLLLEGAFFCNENSIITNDDAPTPENLNSFLDRYPAQFTVALSEQNWSAAKESACYLYDSLHDCRSLSPAQVKDVYYRLFSALESTALELQLLLTESPMYTTWEIVTSSNSLYKLHNLLLEKLDDLDKAAHQQVEENQTVFMMKDYIRRKYAVDTLSVKDISSHVFLSTAYACTLFKTETGQTINQYITEFRLEKAKQLLMDSRYKITDISVKVGYADGNYFGKSFKKYVGLSPSEYREKMLQ